MKLLFISPKDVYASKRIVEEAVKAGLEIEHIAPIEASQADPNEFDGLYTRMVYPYYDEVANLAVRFRDEGKAVWEASDTNKIDDNLELTKASILMPRTFVINEVNKLTYPMVLKTKYGFGKKEVFLIKDEISLHSHTLVYESEDLLAQEYIPADFEYKVISVGYKSLSKILRYKIDSSGFGINSVAFEVLNKDECAKVVTLAESASRRLGRELAKTDILEKGDQLYILEVNRSPGLVSFETHTGVNVAGEFVAYIKQKVTGRNV